MIDTHVHYAHELIRHELREIEKQDRQAGIRQTICLPIEYEENFSMMAATEGFGNMYYAVGIHPLRVPVYPLPVNRGGGFSLKRELGNCKKQQLALEKDRDTLQYFRESMDRLSQMIKNDSESGEHRIVAVGETGIDIHSMVGIQKLRMQKISLFEHILLALRYDLPLVWHIRGEHAADETLSVMKADCFKTTRFRGVWHCFCGTKKDMELMEDDGKNDLVYGIGGKVTKPGRDGSVLRNTLRLLSEEQGSDVILSKIVLETDAPYVTPHGIIRKTGKKAVNRSAYLPEVVNALSGILGVSGEEVIRRTTANACRLFRLNDNTGA